MDENLKREIILDNYTNPANKGKPSDDGEYLFVNTNNSSCIDNIDLWVKIKDNRILDVKFDGEACAISTASTSIMTKELVGKTLDEAEKYIQKFATMTREGQTDREVLQEAGVFDTIYKQANRITCATLPYKGIEKAIALYKEK